MLTTVACDSRQKDEETAAAVRKFDATAKSVTDGLQWNLDKSIAEKLFDDDTVAGLNRFTTFLQCHDEPPTKDTNKKVCAVLQKRVADAKAKFEAQQAKDKADW